MKTADEILKEALKAPSKEPLEAHKKTIETLREKNYSWRDIATFLNDRGVDTNHSKIFRFINKQKGTKMNKYENFEVPSRKQYADALQNIKITDNQKKMLEFHYQAHNRTVTYTELANAAGFEDYETANLQYGKLGRMLGEETAMNFAESENRGKPFYSSAIGSDNPFKSQKQEYQLVMHHELAEALRDLAWFAN